MGNTDMGGSSPSGCGAPVIYTADFGGYDMEYVGPQYRYSEHNDPLRTQGSNKMRAKLYKMSMLHGHSLWIDSSIEITDLGGLLQQEGDGDMTIIRHPNRSTVGEELVVIKQCGLAAHDGIHDGLMALDGLYRGNLDVPLYCGGVIFKRNTPRAHKCMGLWLDMMRKTSLRDQLTLPLAIEKSGISIKVLQFNLWQNSYFMVHAHKS